jgi:hypothetical protein
MKCLKQIRNVMEKNLAEGGFKGSTYKERNVSEVNDTMKNVTG